MWCTFDDLGYIVTVNFIESNSYLRELCGSSQVFMSSRLGVVESNVITTLEDRSTGLSLQLRKQAWVNAGIFPPTRGVLEKFSARYMHALSSSDLIAVWPNGIQKNHDHIVDTLASNVSRIPLGVLDIFRCATQVPLNEIWIQAIANKRVLVIHPFAKSFQVQFERLHSLHALPILPIFTPYFIAPPMTQGLNFSKRSYVEELDIFESKVRNLVSSEEFDLALIAAGAYGLPLTATLKAAGVSSIYVGGALQLYFGVLGNRWTNSENIRPFVTKHWLTSPIEKPPLGSGLIEKGTYW